MQQTFTAPELLNCRRHNANSAAQKLLACEATGKAAIASRFAICNYRVIVAVEIVIRGMTIRFVVEQHGDIPELYKRLCFTRCNRVFEITVCVKLSATILEIVDRESLLEKVDGAVFFVNNVVLQGCRVSLLCRFVQPVQLARFRYSAIKVHNKWFIINRTCNNCAD